MYRFEDVVTLFLDRDEFKSGKLQEFIERTDLIIGNFNEGVASIYMKGEDITISFILELEDILDNTITICSRFLGSSDTIKSLGLD